MITVTTFKGKTFTKIDFRKFVNRSILSEFPKREN